MIRKKDMCVDECALVKEDKTLECQKDCSYEYCSHHCKKGDKAISQINKTSCTSCLEYEYDICQHECEVGSEREKAVCRITCSDTRCKNMCVEKKETGKKKQKN